MLKLLFRRFTHSCPCATPVILATFGLTVLLISACDKAKEEKRESTPTNAQINEIVAFEPQETTSAIEQSEAPWAAEAPAAEWRLVFVDKFEHVLAPLPETGVECDIPSDAQFSDEKDKPYATLKLPRSTPPEVNSALWPTDRKWGVVTLDGTTLTTTLSERVFLVSEGYAGCHYLVSENIGSADTPQANVGELGPAIAYTHGSPSRRAPQLATTHRKQWRGEWALGQSVSQPILLKVAAAVEAAGIPAAYKAQWSEIANDPVYFATVRERRTEGEGNLALAVWRLLDGLGNEKPLWVIARETGSGFTIIPTPEIADDSYHFTPLLVATTDVDGDGNDEVIIHAIYYEGDNHFVWSLSEERVRVLASTPYFGL